MFLICLFGGRNVAVKGSGQPPVSIMLSFHSFVAITAGQQHSPVRSDLHAETWRAAGYGGGGVSGSVNITQMLNWSDRFCCFSWIRFRVFFPPSFELYGHFLKISFTHTHFQPLTLQLKMISRNYDGQRNQTFTLSLIMFVYSFIHFFSPEEVCVCYCTLSHSGVLSWLLSSSVSLWLLYSQFFSPALHSLS